MRTSNALLLAPLFFASCQASEGGDASAAADDEVPRERRFESEHLEGEPMFTVLPMDAIPAIDEPRFLSAEEADAFMQPDEPVLGVVGRDGTAKAYSAWQLEGHEIVNDQLDGAAIAATW